MTSKIFFISGIDTDTGKTIVTGLMARWLQQKGRSYITQKMVQTGCADIADDILTHRQMAGTDLLPEDKAGETCPYIFAHPASPHLSAEMENKEIDPEVIKQTSSKLLQKFDLVLLEGAGGLLVPITRETTIMDYIVAEKLPLLLVSSSKLGSINHTLLSLEVCLNRGVEVNALLYKHLPGSDPIIQKDSVSILSAWLQQHMPDCKLIEIPVLENLNDDAGVDFSCLFA